MAPVLDIRRPPADHFTDRSRAPVLLMIVRSGDAIHCPGHEDPDRRNVNGTWDGRSELSSQIVPVRRSCVVNAETAATARVDASTDSFDFEAVFRTHYQRIARVIFRSSGLFRIHHARRSWQSRSSGSCGAIHRRMDQACLPNLTCG